MKRIGFVVLVVVALLLLITVVQNIRHSTSELPQEKPEEAFRVASYNVHYISMRRDEGSWSVSGWDARKDSMQETVTSLDADIIAFQEMESYGRGVDGAVNLTRDFLLEQNPQYVAGAVGDATVFPSTQPIFYNAEQFTLLDQGWFFFSNTPDVIYSRTFNGSYPAFASWVELQNKKNGEVMKVVNIHVDFSSLSNRRQSVELVVERIQPWLDTNENVLVVGDFNARLGSQIHEYVEAAGMTFAPLRAATYHFNRGINLFGAIDHIAYSDAFKVVGTPAVVQKKFNDMWGSDHYPVVVDVKL